MNDISESEKDIAAALRYAWDRYVFLFGQPPHGTSAQLAALACLVNSDIERRKNAKVAAVVS